MCLKELKLDTRLIFCSLLIVDSMKHMWDGCLEGVHRYVIFPLLTRAFLLLGPVSAPLFKNSLLNRNYTKNTRSLHSQTWNLNSIQKNLSVHGALFAVGLILRIPEPFQVFSLRFADWSHEVDSAVVQTQQISSELHSIFLFLLRYNSQSFGWS